MSKLFIKKDLLKIFFFALTLPSLLLSYGGNTANAQDSSRTGISITPPTFDLTANPGETRQEVIRVTSQSQDVISYDAKVEDFRVEGTEGFVSLQEDVENPGAFSNWFKVTPSFFQLNPGESKLITYTINIPDDAEPGGHFASLLFQPRSVETQSATGAQILQRVGSLILMDISGARNEKGSVGKFVPKTFNGTWTELKNEGDKVVYVAKDEDLKKEVNKSYFNNGPVAFDLFLKNEGNVHYRPSGSVIITNIFGQKVDEINIDPKNVFPGGERRVTVIWPKKNLWGVYYRANATALYGTRNQTLTAQTGFWAFPLPIAIAVLATVLVLLLLRKRIWKALRIIMKGD